MLPHDMSRGSPTRLQKRHKAEVADVDLARPLELVVLALKSNATRGRVVFNFSEVLTQCYRIAII